MLTIIALFGEKNIAYNALKIVLSFYFVSYCIMYEAESINRV